MIKQHQKERVPHLLFILLILIGVSLLSFNVAAENLVVQTTGQFHLELPSNTEVGPESSGVSFQPDSEHIIVLVCSTNENDEHRGDLNASAASVWFLKGGCLQFTVDSQIGTGSTGAAFIRVGGNVSKIQVKGSYNYPNTETFTSSGTYNILLDVRPGETVTISWDIYPTVGTIPIMLIIGVTGFLFVFLGVLLTLYKFREHDWEWLLWGFVIVIIGICLIIAWLWS